ncbi:MAG: polyprenyl synthetase family protein [Tibeticola sp.]
MTPAAAFDFAAWSHARRAEVEAALDAWVPADAAADLGQAMRYAVLDGGKRLRPLLVFAAAQSVATAQAQAAVNAAALRAACAVELIHAYSLVHDDLPCMDNDVLRRGKPTVHVRFGEAQALLAGDALQALAFELLTPDDGSLAADVQARLCGLLTRAAGHAGMAGGQAIDLASVGRALEPVVLRDMHRRKTGALLAASVLMGAAAAGLSPQSAAWQALGAYGEALGLAFQIVDDVLDVTADAATLGKTAGKDAAANKPTYVALLGLEGARAEALALHRHALDGLSQLQRAYPGADVAALTALADAVVRRDH